MSNIRYPSKFKSVVAENVYLKDLWERDKINIQIKVDWEIFLVLWRLKGTGQREFKR